MVQRDVFLPKPDLKLGHYRHYKGGEYTVLMLVCDEATHEWLVIYEALYDTVNTPRIWARKYDVFTEMVKIEDTIVPRFTYLDEQDIV